MDNISPAQPIMQYRSLGRLFALQIVTLGFYELVWLAKTRQEMVSKFGVQIPPVKRMLGVIGYQIASLIVVLVLIIFAIPSLNHKIRTAPDNPSPSQQCQIDYAANRPVSKSCRDSVDEYWGATSPKQKYTNYMTYTLIAVMVLILSGVLSSIGVVRWMKRYAAGVSVVTNGRISYARAVNYLTLLPPTVRMMVVQSAYNKAG